MKDKPEIALRVAQEIRQIGNKLFKEGKVDKALDKYQSSWSLYFFPVHLG